MTPSMPHRGNMMDAPAMLFPVSRFKTVWVGTGLCGIDAIICVAELVKGDSEIKILIDCTEEEKRCPHRARIR